MPESIRTPPSTRHPAGDGMIAGQDPASVGSGTAEAAAPRAAMQLGGHPGRVPLVLRVGVVGESQGDVGEANPGRLTAQMRDNLRQIARVAEGIVAAAGGSYAAQPPLLRLISTLSTGSERLVAREALALGYVLECPLPFDRDRIDRTFAQPSSRSEFRTLLERASAVLELDGSGATPAEVAAADHAANQIMLAHSDLLIAVWDGDGERDGTPARLVSQARQASIPVIQIQARFPHEVRVLVDVPEPQESPLERLGELLAPSLLPADSAAEGMRAYFAETYPGWSLLGGIWPLYLRG